MSQQSELWLMLMRHGEAEELSSSKPDFSRVLTAEGRRDAFATGAALKSKYFIPQVGFASDAMRASQTAEELAKAWSGYTWMWEHGLYHAGLPDIVQCVTANLASTFDRISSIICVGHNPGWSYAAMTLTKEYVTLATANLVVLRIQASHWLEALQMRGCWELCDVIQPSQ